MQNEKTLIELGFKFNNEEYRWIWKGKYQIFIASIGEDGKHIVLRQLSPEIDRRPLSDNRGKHYTRLVKDCVSEGSVFRALKKFDVEESRIRNSIGGIFLKNT